MNMNAYTYITTAAVVLSAVFTRRVFAIVRGYFLLRQLPRPASQPLLLGSAAKIARPDLHRTLRDWSRELGGIFTFRLFFRQVVVVVDARLAHLVLGAQHKLNKAVEPALSDALLSHGGHHTMFSAGTDSAYWQVLRRGTAPAFSLDNIRGGFGAITRVLDQVCDNLASRPEADLNNAMLRFAMDITGHFIFAKDYGATRSFDDANTDDMLSIMKQALGELMQRSANPARPLVLWSREVRAGAAAFRRFRAAMAALVAEVRAMGPPLDNDASVAAHLLRLRDPATGERLSDALLAGEFGMFFTAGLETSGNAISWTLYLISQHPGVEAKLAAELDQAGLLVTRERPKPRGLEYADLGRLTYLSWVCKEAMRVLPVASTGTTRIARTDLLLGGYTIPKGAAIIVPFDAVHHFPGNWANPDAFTPERWAEPGCETSKSPGFKTPALPAATATAHVFRGAAAAPGALGEGHTGALRARAQEGKARHTKAAFSLTADSTVAGSSAKRFIPFSAGPRMCLGMPLARVMHDAAVARMVSQFRLALAPRMGGPAGVEAAAINRLTLQPGAGMWMLCRPRG